MSPSKKMSKHQIREDKLVTKTFQTTEYIQKNPKPFIIGGIVLAVLFSAVVILKYIVDKRKEDASNLYIRANMSLAMGNLDGALADFNSLVNDYGSSTYARSARLMLANKYFGEKDWDRSQEEFEKLLKNSGNDKMIESIAAAGLASCYEQKSDFANAGKYYFRAYEIYENPIFSPANLIKAGQNYAKAGDKTNASAAFKIIEEKFNTSSEAAAARRHLAEISL